MIYPRTYNTKGILLFDILISFSITLVLVVVISQSMQIARESFFGAYNKEISLKNFDLATDYENIITPGISKKYGNDRVENASSSFVSIYNAKAKTRESVGEPLCSVNFSSKDIVGSYMYSLPTPHVSTSSISIKKINLPIEPVSFLTDLEIRDGIAYISADSSKLSDPDLYIVDIHDRDSTKLLSSIDTGPGLGAIAIGGKRVYGAGVSTVAQLHIIRLDGLDSLVLEKRFSLPKPFATSTLPFASSIQYRDGFVFLGTEKWSGNEFSIISVRDPITPIVVSSWETGSKINEIYENNKFIYITASDEKQLRVLQTTDYLHPVELAYSNPPGWSRQEGKTISYFEDRLDWGRTTGGFDYKDEYELFSLATTSTTTISFARAINEPGGIYGIVADREHLFVITRSLDKEFKIFNLDESLLPIEGKEYSFSLPIVPQKITCDLNNIYILARSSPTIYEISFTK